MTTQNPYPSTPSTTQLVRGADLRPSMWVSDRGFYGLIASVTDTRITYTAGSHEPLDPGRMYQVIPGPPAPTELEPRGFVGSALEPLTAAVLTAREDGSYEWKPRNHQRPLSHEAVEEYHSEHWDSLTSPNQEMGIPTAELIAHRQA